MGAQGLVGDLFHNLIRGSNHTKREYYLQSLALVAACRRLPEPIPWLNDRQRDEDLTNLLRQIESAVLSGASKEAKPENVQANIKKANDLLGQYITKYNLNLKDWETAEYANAAVKDANAATMLKDVESKLKLKLGKIKKMSKQDLDMRVWPEYPTSYEGQKYTSDSLQISGRIRIEQDANMDMVIHRLLEYMAEQPERRGLLALYQNPQLYGYFPTSHLDWHSQNPYIITDKSQAMYIPFEKPHNTVRSFKGKDLNLIMNRRNPEDRLVHTKNTSITLPEDCTNGWPLIDSHHIGVRAKSLNYALYLFKGDFILSLDDFPVYDMPAPAPKTSPPPFPVPNTRQVRVPTATAPVNNKHLTQGKPASNMPPAENGAHSPDHSNLPRGSLAQQHSLQSNPVQRHQPSAPPAPPQAVPTPQTPPLIISPIRQPSVPEQPIQRPPAKSAPTGSASGPRSQAVETSKPSRSPFGGNKNKPEQLPGAHHFYDSGGLEIVEDEAGSKRYGFRAMLKAGLEKIANRTR